MKSLLIISMFIFIAGCAGTRAAYRAADGLEETAYVMNQHYLGMVNEANDLRESGDLSGRALANAQSIVADSRPLLQSLSNAARAYTAVQSAETQQELTDAIAAAAVELSNLLKALKNAGGSVKLLDRIEDDLLPFAA